GIIVEATTAMCRDARTHFPAPHQPLRGDLVDVDRFSLQDRIMELEMDEGRRIAAESFWSTISSAQANEVGIVSALRWCALAGHAPEPILATPSGATLPAPPPPLAPAPPLAPPLPPP